MQGGASVKSLHSVSALSVASCTPEAIKRHHYSGVRSGVCRLMLLMLIFPSYIQKQCLSAAVT